MSTHAHFRQLSPYQVCERCRLNVGIKQAVSHWDGVKNIFLHPECYEQTQKEHKTRDDED